MASTYSYPIETTTDNSLLTDVLTNLRDNFAHEIDPRDVRDSIYYLWQNIIFKPTTIGTGIQYIGIDETSVKEKILIGKKERQDGVFVMNNNLLNSDGDIFFYNSKTGSSNFDTKLVFLAGTSSNYFGGEILAPSLKSTVVTDTNGSYINLELKNSSYVTDLISGTVYGGDINIQSSYGYVNVNNLNLPTQIQNSDAIDGYVLTIRNSGGNHYAKWEAPTASSTTPLVYFSDANEVPQTIGGINAGETFSNVLIQEMMRRLIYPYIAPTLTLTLPSYYAEATDAYSILTTALNYSIVVTSTYSVNYFVSSPSTSLTSGLLAQPFTKGTTSSSASASFTTNISIGTTYDTKTFSLVIGDTSGKFITSSTYLKIVLPWYYGTSDIGSTSSTGIGSILGTVSSYVDNKLTPIFTDPVLSSSSEYNKSVDLTGNQKYIYFGYPSQFPSLVQILDNNNLDVTGSFLTYSVSISSPLGKWANKPYRFYVYVGPSGVTPSITTIGSPFNGYTENYQFLFATAS